MTPKEHAHKVARDALHQLDDSAIWKVIVHWVERALVAEAKLERCDRVRPEMR